MQQVAISSKGQIAIPKRVREALNLTPGARLNLEVRGHDIILSKGSAWKRLEGAASTRGGDLMVAFEKFRKEEREREDSRP